ncbi:MAG: hypothetical protein RBS55_09765, partial [Bacteroidales bacterium]|nr:hypothetical protein [Bacteroidales bacterium]
MAYQKSYVDLDMLKNQLLNAVLHTGATAAIDAALTVAGQIGFDTTLHRPKYHTGSVIREIASLDGSETLSNKTLTSPVINTQVTGDAIITYAGGGIAGWLEGCSDLKIPTEKAVFAAITSGIGANDAMVYKGAIDCSSEPNYPAADAGHTYKVSVGGKIGGEFGPVVEAGDTLICTEDGMFSGNHSEVGAYWNIIQFNVDILPTLRGGTGSSINVTTGDMLFGDGSSNSFVQLPIGLEGQVLRSASDGFPEWSYAGVYDAWVLQVNSDLDGHGVFNGYSVDFIAGSGIGLGFASGSNNYAVTISLNSIFANQILANATSSMAVPTGFSVSTSGVVGRLATGNIANIPFGTTANTVAWGDHTHSQLHNQQHAIVGSDHTASGLLSGQIIIATGATTFEWSAITLPLTCAIGDILYASATNSWTTLAKGTDGKVLTMVAGSPAWANPTSTYSHWTITDNIEYFNVENGFTLALIAGGGLIGALQPSATDASWLV